MITDKKGRVWSVNTETRMSIKNLEHIPYVKVSRCYGNIDLRLGFRIENDQPLPDPRVLEGLILDAISKAEEL